MPGGGGPRPNAGRRKGSKDLKPRVRRSQAEIALAAADVDADLQSWDAQGDRKAIDLASAVLNGNPPECVEVEYPLKLDTFIRLAALCAPYQSPRLQSVSVKTDDDQRQHIELIERLHNAAMARNQHDTEHGHEVAGIIAKLPEDEAVVLRKAIGAGAVIDGRAN
ncbi:MAG: hypothetical protein ACR2PG_15045 [Hyphomicrobiaceae bacterium]